jgi:long-chain acyl-CoA synthetase
MRLAVFTKNRSNPAYAAARLGAILVPVNWRLSPDEVAHVISDTTPVILMADAEYQPVVGGLAAKNPSVKRCIALGAAQAGFEPYEGLLADHPPAPPLDVDADAGFTIMHTAAVR